MSDVFAPSCWKWIMSVLENTEQRPAMGSTFVARRVCPDSPESGMASRWACSSRKEPVPAEQLELKKNFTREASFFENLVIKLARAAPMSMMQPASGAIAM